MAAATTTAAAAAAVVLLGVSAVSKLAVKEFRRTQSGGPADAIIR